MFEGTGDWSEVYIDCVRRLNNACLLLDVGIRQEFIRSLIQVSSEGEGNLGCDSEIPMTNPKSLVT